MQQNPILKQEFFPLHSERVGGTFSQGCWQRLHLNQCRPDGGTPPSH